MATSVVSARVAAASFTRVSRACVTLGEPVTAEELALLGSRETVVGDLRRRTLSLR